MDDCVKIVARAAEQRNIALAENESEAIIKELRKQLGKRKIHSADELQVAVDVSFENVKAMRLQARQAKREALLRIVKRNEINDRINSYTSGPTVKFLRQKTQSARELEAYEAQQVGTTQFTTGARDSAANNISAETNGNISSLLSALNSRGETLETALRKGSFDKEAYVYAYNKKADVPEEAKGIVDAISSVLNGLRERKNRAGAFIGERLDFLVKQLHDSELIRKTPFQQYLSDFLRLVDHDRTFGPGASLKDKEEYISDVYKRFSAGSHYKVDEGGDQLAGTARGINLAKKMSQQRQIHFKDGESAFDYATKYSRGSLFDKVVQQLEYDAKAITMLERYGPNPRAMHETIKRDLQVRAQQRGEPVSPLALKVLDTNFAKLNGELDIPASSSLAHIGFGFRALESMSKLGGAVLSAFPDIVFKGAALNRMTDMGFFGSYITAFLGSFFRLPKSERKFFGEMTGVMTDGTLGNAYRRAGAIDGMPGAFAKAQELFFRINLLQGWTVNNKAGVISAFTFYLGRYRNTSFDALPKKTKRTLELYNINADEWSLMKHMDTLEVQSKKHFVTEGGVASIADDFIDPVISKKFGTTDVTDNLRLSFRDELASKLRSMNHDFAETAVITPGAKEQVIMTLGTQKGTLLGEFVRMIGQFRAFPVAVITKQILPEYYGAGGGARGAAALVPMLVLATAFGYLSGAAKDLVKGREPKDPKSLETWQDAMLRGGGMGLFGDFLFAEYSRFGRSFQETLLGPGINTISEAAALAHKAATSNGADASDFFKQVKGITPGANLFYTEAAFNYLFYYGLMESLDPGFLRRTERDRLKNYDQDFWLPPTESAVQF